MKVVESPAATIFKYCERSEHINSQLSTFNSQLSAYALNSDLFQRSNKNYAPKHLNASGLSFYRNGRISAESLSSALIIRFAMSFERSSAALYWLR